MGRREAWNSSLWPQLHDGWHVEVDDAEPVDSIVKVVKAMGVEVAVDPPCLERDDQQASLAVGTSAGLTSHRFDTENFLPEFSAADLLLLSGAGS